MAVERALTTMPKTEVKGDAVCYICMDREGPDGGAVPLRGCACRGPSAGFVHVDCLAEMARRDKFMTVAGRGRMSRWTYCAVCYQMFTGALEVSIDRSHWRHFRQATTNSVDKCEALTTLARTLLEHKEFTAADRLYEGALRDVAGDAIYRDILLQAQISRAGALSNMGRPRDAFEILTRLQPMMVEEPGVRVARHADYNKVITATLVNVGRAEDALPVAARAVELSTIANGPQSREALDGMCVQAQLFAAVGRVQEAKAMLGHVLAARTRLLGPLHEMTRKTQDALRRIEARTA